MISCRAKISSEFKAEKAYLEILNLQNKLTPRQERKLRVFRGLFDELGGELGKNLCEGRQKMSEEESKVFTELPKSIHNPHEYDAEYILIPGGRYKYQGKMISDNHSYRPATVKSSGY